MRTGTRRRSSTTKSVTSWTPIPASTSCPGCQKLDGFQGLAYVRARHLPCDANAPDFARIGRQQQFMRAVINQMLKPAQIAKAPGLVAPVLASLHRDQGFLPGDLVYLVGQMRGLSTGAVEFRAVPATFGMENGLSVLHMDPSAEQIFRAIHDGNPITGVGTQLVNTPPSEANTTVAVIDAGGGDAAQQVEDTLTNAGFNITPGIVSGVAPKGVKGAAILYRPGDAAYADVVSKYFPGLQVVEVKGLEESVAILVPTGYHPATPGQGRRFRRRERVSEPDRIDSRPCARWCSPAVRGRGCGR